MRRGGGGEKGEEKKRRRRGGGGRSDRVRRERGRGEEEQRREEKRGRHRVLEGLVDLFADRADDRERVYDVAWRPTHEDTKRISSRARRPAGRRERALSPVVRYRGNHALPNMEGGFGPRISAR